MKNSMIKGQKGQALILALIFLAVGALVIMPALAYTYTGMRSVQVYGDALARLYASDSAIDDALWQLLNQFIGTFSPGDPQVAYDFQLGASHLNVTIKIPTVPPSTNYGTGNVHNLMVTVKNPSAVQYDMPPSPLDPDNPYRKNAWVEETPVVLEYIMRIDMQTYNLTVFKYTLPKGLAYTVGSSYYCESPSRAGWPAGNSELAWDAQIDVVNQKTLMKNGQWRNNTPIGYTVVYQWPPPGGQQAGVSYLYLHDEADGRQTLEFRPYFGSPSGRRIFIQTIRVSGTPEWGINFVSPAMFQGGFGTITADQTAAVGVAMYTIDVPIGGVTYRVVVGFNTTTGTFEIVSYQALE